MKKIRAWLLSNELFVKIILVVISSILIVSFITFSIVLNQSKKSYIANYKQSNQVLMTKIQKDYESLNDNMTRIFNLVDTSPVVEEYLTSPTKSSGTIVELFSQLEATRSIFNNMPSNLILIGKNKATFVQNSNIKTEATNHSLTSDIAKKMEKNQAISDYFFLDSGPTTDTVNKPGLLFVRKLTNKETAFGYALIFVSEEHFSSIYRELLDDNLHNITIVNADNQIISSNHVNQLGTSWRHDNSQSRNFEMTELPLYSYHFTLYNQIDLQHLVANMNLIQPTLVVTLIVILSISFIAFFIIKKTTKPIYQLIDSLPTVTKDNFKGQIEITGSHEVRELGKSYNLMLQDLDNYFNDLMKTEADKRLIEINGLLLQIQPHFIYNTLTAIKFLIWQHDNDRAIEAIDDFTALLRHTISDQKEFVSLEQELASIEAYTSILKLRYGSQIKTVHHLDPDCSDALVPKLIIQPMIENAYLHAFPNGRTGVIQLFIRKHNDYLSIEIMDNGVGFDPQKMEKKETSDHLYYSSIGLENIQKRLALIYQDEASFQLFSSPEIGTTISLLIPFQT